MVELIMLAFVWPAQFECKVTSEPIPELVMPFFEAQPYCRSGTDCQPDTRKWICEDKCHVETPPDAP